MKTNIGKCLLLSTTILGLINPLVALADTQTKMSSIDAETFQSNSDKPSKNVKDNLNNVKKAPINNPLAVQTFPWGDSGLNITVVPDSSDATKLIVHVPAGEVTNPEPIHDIDGLRDIFDNNDTVYKIDGPLKINGDASMLFSGGGINKNSGLNQVDVSNVTMMRNMFAGDDKSYLDFANQLDNWDTSNVTNMAGMFSLAHINSDGFNMKNFDTSKVTDMGWMFATATFDPESINNKNKPITDAKWSELDLSTWNTSNVTDMGVMFSGMIGLNVLNISSFDTSKANTSLFLNGLGLFEVILGDKLQFHHNDGEIYDPELKYMTINEKAGIEYTGKWQNIGDGTPDFPKGKNVWSGKEFQANYQGDRDAGAYVWQPVVKPGADVTVKYVNEDGKTISPDTSLSGDINEPYTVTKKNISGYIFEKSQAGNEIGKFTDQAQTVTMVYKKVTTATPTKPVVNGKVTVKYVDEANRELAKSEALTGKAGDHYTTKQKDISGYTFKKVQGTENGIFKASGQTVTYVYTKNPEKGADVTVKYMDENGKAIAKSETKRGNVGDKYTTEKKELTGYTFKEVKGSTNGEFTDKAQTVTYIYTKNDENSVKPSEPVQPNTPDNQTDSNTNAKNETTNNVVNRVVNNVETMLPKTSAQKLTLIGIVSVVIASLAGLVVWKKRK
ncbi:BspA family leucine-rich repeat surface protein [Weissella coleopterorum]|uniref:BspA family leucine-rich repeat surface protein n=1 Tax=Weissella coleopterorum TaxID=2714949 RepID=A0A6G8B1C9_9LACO|nr:MucBP domain-containing protein [Weissella coleopterorum]QIL51056.1 BspA family leucine-rich repeat surface protein [Weissella coleopterorum]